MVLYKIIFFICFSTFLGLTGKHTLNLSNALNPSKVLMSKPEIKDQSRDLLDQINVSSASASTYNRNHNLIANLHVQSDIVKQNKNHNDLVLLNNFLKKEVNPTYQKALQILTNKELEQVYIKNIEGIRDELLTMSAQIMKKDTLINQSDNKNKNLSLQIAPVKTLSVNNTNNLPSEKKNLLDLLSTG